VDNDVVGYNIDLNQGDIIIATGNVDTYEITGLSGGTLYTVRVSAFDASGNESALSSSITVTTNQ
jgi:predicted secreted Zn-dependent protease